MLDQEEYLDHLDQRCVYFCTRSFEVFFPASSDCFHPSSSVQGDAGRPGFNYPGARGPTVRCSSSPCVSKVEELWTDVAADLVCRVREERRATEDLAAAGETVVRRVSQAIKELPESPYVPPDTHTCW